MNQLKLQMEDRYIENQKLKALLENEQLKESKWKKQVDELYNKINIYVQKKDSLERDLSTSQELLKVTETTSKAYVRILYLLLSSKKRMKIILP